MKAKLAETVSYLRERTDFSPAVGIILGSGFAGLEEEVRAAAVFAVREIPHFPVPRAKGHVGRAVLGEIAGEKVFLLAGRPHFYEGYTCAQVTYPVRVMHALGVRTLILTNAAGAVNPAFSPGELMLIRDHLNFLGANPLRPPAGPGEEEPLFVDLSQAYTPRLRALAKEVARTQGVTLYEGVYAALPGPSYETPAEVRFLRTVGADAVGMSTVPEVIVACALGMEVLAISFLTNRAGETEISHAEVLRLTEEKLPMTRRLLKEILAALAAGRG